MSAFLKRVKYRFMELIGLDQMQGEFSLVFYIHLFFLVYSTLEKVFINTLLFNVFGTMKYVILYRGIVFIITAISMQISAYLLQKVPSKVVTNISVFIYLTMYSLLFFGLDHMKELWSVIAVFSGIGTAFYWSSHNVLILNYSNPRNRGLALSITGLTEGMVTLLLPLVAGVVIGQVVGNLGYRIMFGFGMAIALIQVFFNNKLAKIQSKQKKSQLRLAFEIIKRDIDFRYMLVSEFIRGMRDGVFMFIMNMLLFQIITNETLTGVNTFIGGIAAIMGSWAYGRLVRDKKAKHKYFFSATTIILACTLMMFINMSPAVLIIFTAINGFLQLFMTTSNSNTTYNLVSKHKFSQMASSELLALREMSMAIGRTLGLLLLLNVPQVQFGYVLSMFLLTAVQYLGLHFIKKIDKGVYA